jgi:hypothetical protein
MAMGHVCTLSMAIRRVFFLRVAVLGMIGKLFFNAGDIEVSGATIRHQEQQDPRRLRDASVIATLRLHKKEGRGIGSPFPLSDGSAEPYSFLPISSIRSEQRQA